MSPSMKALLISAALMISANVHAVTGTFTVSAQNDPQGPAGFISVGYCRAWGVCAYCDRDWDPSCQSPLYYGYGAISNQYLSDGKEVIVVVENSAHNIVIYIETGSNPGGSYVTHVAIGCNGGTRNFSSPLNSYAGGGWHTVSVSTSSQCMTAGNNYSITVS